MESVKSYNSDFANNYFDSKTKPVETVTSNGKDQGAISDAKKSVFGVNESLGKQQFLELLVTQLRYQDPLNPSDDQQFIAQLAQFSNLESSQNIESDMSDLSKSLNAFVEKQDGTIRELGNSSATGLLGKYALIEKEEFYFNGNSQSVPMFKESNGSSLIQISDLQGNVVYEEPVTGQGGYFDFEWDGKTGDQGDKVKSGSYNIKITDISGDKQEGFAFVQDYISAITYENGSAKISVDGNSYNLEDIKQIVEISE